MKLKKKKLNNLRNKFGSHYTFLFYIEENGVREDHAEEILDDFTARFGYLCLEGMDSTEFRDLLHGVVSGYLDGKAVAEEFQIK